MGGISIWQLLIVALIVVLLFGTNKLRTLGSDLGSAIKGFKKAVSDEPPAEENKSLSSQQDADFNNKSLTDNQAESVKKTEEATSKNKEQV